MWGPGPWMGPMWGFWWIVPLIGLIVCLAFAVCAYRALTGRGQFMCMGGHDRDSKEDDLQREVRELREEVNRLKAAR